VKERTVELENLNRELKDLNESKDKFISVISHDIRNPFTALLASSEKLDRDLDKLNTTQIQKLSHIINRTSKRILEQLNELVERAKTQNDKTNFHPETIHLVKGLDESLELLKSNAAQKKITLKNKVPAGIYVNADSLMLRSIVQNLVTNAIKYTPNGGQVSITAQTFETMVEVCVEDSGVGMPLEIKENLFTTIDSSTNGTNNERGTGLGLMLVRDFVAQHGGGIDVKSEVGKGTCFTFSIPGFATN
jgi:two-component system, sensor histidine kinase and response regulator